MNCRKAQRSLALFFKDDLGQKQREMILTHISGCPACQDEIARYRRSQDKMKTWLEKDAVKWEGGEWKKILNRAKEPSEKKISPFAPWPFKKGWAFACMLLFTVLLSVFVIQPAPLKRFLGIGSNSSASLQKGFASKIEQVKKQETILMTMVSRESGLKIVWIFDKDFSWEEDQ